MTTILPQDPDLEFDDKRDFSELEEDQLSGAEDLSEVSPEPENDEAEDNDDDDDDDAELYQPPSTIRRATWIIILLSSFLLAFLAQVFLFTKRQPEIIYASRYSKEHKYRPAASPIITETLKDGRIRIRGGNPTPTSQPVKTTSAKKKRKPSAGKASGRKPKGGRKKQNPNGVRK